VRRSTDADRWASPPARLDLDRLLEAQSLGGEPLFVAMSGLLAAKQGVDAALRLRADELALRLAADELDRIGRFWTGRGLPALGDLPLPAHLAAAVTLAGGVSAAAARALIDQEAAAFGVMLPGDRRRRGPRCTRRSRRRTARWRRCCRTSWGRPRWS
jgi:hypothetical protein